jgi:hypothetical protein
MWIRVTRFPADQLGANGATAIGVQITNSGRTFYVNTARGNFRSDDGARTFVPIERGYRGAQVSDLAFDAGGRLLVPLVNSAGMFRATQAGTKSPAPRFRTTPYSRWRQSPRLLRIRTSTSP